MHSFDFLNDINENKDYILVGFKKNVIYETMQIVTNVLSFDGSS